MNKMEEVRQDLERLCDIVHSYGLTGESKVLKAHIDFLYEVIEDRTKDIIHLHNLLDNQKAEGKEDE